MLVNLHWKLLDMHSFVRIPGSGVTVKDFRSEMRGQNDSNGELDGKGMVTAIEIYNGVEESMLHTLCKTTCEIHTSYTSLLVASASRPMHLRLVQLTSLFSAV